MTSKSLLLLCATLALSSGGAYADQAPVANPDAKQQWEGWRAARVARLQKPDGWLSLVGLAWVEPGKRTVGSAKENDIVLEVGPTHLGTVELADGHMRFTLADGVEGSAGAEGQRSGALVTDLEASKHPDTEPTLVRFGTASFFAIERNGRYALRVKDSEAETRKHFLGIDMYPFEPDFVVSARFERHPKGSTIEVANVLGYLEPMDNSGV